MIQIKKYKINNIIFLEPKIQHTIKQPQRTTQLH